MTIDVAAPPKTRLVGDRAIKDLVVPMEFKADMDRREIIAYASVFDVLDRQGDIVVPGAFKRTIKEDGKRIKVLYQHDTTRLIGIPRHLEEDSKGLLTVSKISNVPDGDIALQLAADGVLDRMSIGFEIRKASEFEDEELRSQLTGFAAMFPMHHLEELKLWEYSPVTFAANDEADVIAVRSAGGGWIPLFDQRSWPSSQPTTRAPTNENRFDVVPMQPTPALDQLMGSDKAADLIKEATRWSGLPMEERRRIMALEVGTFVSWGDQHGKILSLNEDQATVQVYDGDEPTSDATDVRLAELNESAPPAAPAESEPTDEPTDAEPQDETCPSCGKRVEAIEVQTPAPTFEVEADLITQLRSFALS